MAVFRSDGVLRGLAVGTVLRRRSDSLITAPSMGRDSRLSGNGSSGELLGGSDRNRRGIARSSARNWRCTLGWRDKSRRMHVKLMPIQANQERWTVSER